MTTTAVLVHGLWHGGWSWAAVREELDARGVASVAVDLPMQTLDEDVAVVSAALDALDGRAVLVGHSYGGAVVTAAGAHAAVARLVYLAAFQLDAGESISRVHPEIAPSSLGAALRISADGQQVDIDPERARDLLYDGALDATVDAALARLTPVGRALFSARPARIAWRERPSTYAVCTEDRTVSPALQRVLAERATDRVEWPTGHTPLLSAPALVADLIAVIAATVAPVAEG